MYDLQFVAWLLLLPLLLLRPVEPQRFNLHVNVTAKTTARGFAAHCERPDDVIWFPAAVVQDFAVSFFFLSLFLRERLVFAKLLTLFGSVWPWTERVGWGDVAML